MIDYIIAILILFSAGGVLLASAGMLTFNNLLARMHLVTKVTSFALMIMLIAINLAFPAWSTLIKSVIIFIMLVFLSPISSYLIAQASRQHKDVDDK